MKKLLLLLVGFVLGALSVYLYCCSQDQEFVESPVPPKGVITPSQARDLDRAFDIRHKLISDSIVNRPDNRSSWFALKDVRAYLDYAEHYSDSLGYKMDGVRVYLGAYPTVKDQAGYTTVFFVPTGSENTSEGSMLNYRFQSGSTDIEGAPGFNKGSDGEPPAANYPQ